MLFTASLVSLAAVPAVFGAAFPIVNMKRGAVSGATWFAYGNGISGMPVLYNTTDGTYSYIAWCYYQPLSMILTSKP